MLTARDERPRVQGVVTQQRRDQRCVREVREDGAVPGEEQLRRVEAPEPSGVHLGFEPAAALLEQRTERAAELLGEDRTAVERFPSCEADEVGMLLEELERGSEHALDLGPALLDVEGRLVDELEPPPERVEHHGAVQRVLGGEVVQEALAPDPDLVGDVVEARARGPVGGEAAQRDCEDELLGAWVDRFRAHRDLAARRRPLRQAGRATQPTDQQVVMLGVLGPFTSFHPLLGIVVGLLVTQLGIFMTTIYLHRGLAHRGLTVHPVLAVVLRFMLWVTTGMRPREWAAVHRLHHAATDTPLDPHSPAIVGFWRVQLANAALYRRVARDGVTTNKYARDLPPDRLDRWFFDHAFLGLGIGVTFLIVTLGWSTGLLAAAVHTVGYLGLSGAINAVGHTVGTRPASSSATNLRSLALVTAGEGLHNNHHAAPTAARFSFRRSEIDPAWYVIRALGAVGLVKVRHAEPKVREAQAA